MLDTLTIDSFTPHKGSTFHLQVADGESLDLELVEIGAMGAKPKEGRQAFSCVFRGPESALLPQQIYPLSHAELGEMELFLVPLGPAGRETPGFLYEAVFT